MTTITSPEQADPYRYGWRDIVHPLPNGEERFERLPLTLEDILHPEVGDFRVNDTEHQDFCAYLYTVLRASLIDHPTALVLSKVRVSWDVPDLRPHGPDIAVIFGVAEKKIWSTFDTACEGTKPSLIIEVTYSPTRSLDLVDKVAHYQQAGVAYYVIVDRGEDEETRRLLGYHLTPFGYQPLPTNERGWLWVEPVKIWLAFHGEELVCYDESNEHIPDYLEAVAKLKAVIKAHAKAKARLAEAQARLERMRGGMRDE